MRKVFTLALCTAFLAAAAAKDNLAILPFTGGQGEEGETIAELFSFEKELTAVFNPVPRTSINRAIRGEQRFQLGSGLTDPDTAAALGKQLGAQYVVSGSITALGNQKLLIIAILKIDDLRQIAGDVQAYTDIEEIEGKLPGMARNIAVAARGDASKLPRLAVPPVALSGGADPRAADVLARILAAHIIRGGKYAVYPRTASLEQIEDEYANQFSGDTADEHLPDLGRGTNPELVLSVAARKLGTRNMFNAAIINLETGVQEAGETVNYQSLEDGVLAVEKLAASLSGKEWKPDAPNTTALSGNRRDYTVSDASTLAKVIAAINADTRDGDYTITMEGNAAAVAINLTGNAVKQITLKGDTTVRAITNNSNKPLFTVPVNITLVLDNNLVLNGNHKEASLVEVLGGSLVMKTGSTLRDGGCNGVFVSGGSFTMEGGTISGNGTSGDGSLTEGNRGGVFIEGGSFTMNGGTISDNGGICDGGGVFVGSDGSFAMSGGTISDNGAEINSYGRGGGDGGGVYVDSDGSFTMSGGTISGNTADNYGGGVYLSGGIFTMIYGTISDNGAGNSLYGSGDGGGVYLGYGSVFIMEGGTISGNKACYDDGGGVFVGSGSFTMSGGTISGNTADNYGGGVYVSGGSFTKRGGTIDADNAASRGKVVYVYKGYDNNYKSIGWMRNSAAGPGDNLDSSVDGRAGGWE